MLGVPFGDNVFDVSREGIFEKRASASLIDDHAMAIANSKWKVPSGALASDNRPFLLFQTFKVVNQEHSGTTT